MEDGPDVMRAKSLPDGGRVHEVSLDDDPLRDELPFPGRKIIEDDDVDTRFRGEP